eukprot:8934771-Pyramimonas_sp.AAC.3
MHTFADAYLNFLHLSKPVLAPVIELDRTWSLKKVASDIQMSVGARFPKQQRRRVNRLLSAGRG